MKSNKRKILLLTQLAIIVYTIFNGTDEAKPLAWLLVPMWLMSVVRR